MQHELNQGGREQPVFLVDFADVKQVEDRGFYFAFQDPDEVECDLMGPYDTRELALEAAARVTSDAIRAEATESLLATTRGMTEQ